MKNDYIFSIIIAVYNSAPFLRETLDSVIAQRVEGFYRYKNGAKTDEPIERERVYQVIAVDDGSTDTSGEICDEYSAKYPNFTVIHKVNGGVASARNLGMINFLRICFLMYIIFLSDTMTKRISLRCRSSFSMLFRARIGRIISSMGIQGLPTSIMNTIHP